MTFAQDIEEVADGETIENIVIGSLDNYEISKPERIGQVLTWEEAKEILSYSYDDGFGLPECHAITAWTANKVIFVSEYDGSTTVTSVPRHPIAHKPIMPGG